MFELGFGIGLDLRLILEQEFEFGLDSSQN